MKFLTSEKDLVINLDGIFYFYSADLPLSVGSMITNSMVKIHDHVRVVCVDLHSFPNLAIRFDITEIPTLIVIKNGIETKRFSGIPSKKNLDDILSN